MMMRKNNSSGSKGFLCTRQLLALLLAVVMMTGTAMTFAACGNKAEETDVDLTETISADDETTTDDAEEATGEVSEENSEENTDESAEAGTADGTDTETADGTEAEESTSVLDDTTKAVNVDETTTEAETADANGYTYTTISDTIMYVKQQVNVRSIPSKDGEKLGALSAGTPVTVTGQCNETGWYRIAFNGTSGYVSNNYLVASKSEVETTTQASTTTQQSTTKSNESSTTKKTETSTTTKKSTETTTTKKATYATMTEKYLALGINSLTSSEIETLYEEFADAVIEQVNEERAAANLPAYKTSSLLNEAAMIRAKELATSYSHTRPDGTICSTVLSEVGFLYTSSGENAAMGQVTPAEVMKAWMNSSGHKANILDQPFILDETTGEYTYVNSYVDGYYGYDTIGVGVYYKDGVFYWIQTFAHEHIHTWGKYTSASWVWSDDIDDFVYIEETRAYCTGCSAWKDVDGVIHDEN